MRALVEVAPGDLDELRADLFAAGYTVGRLAELWGVTASAALRRGDSWPARHVTAASHDPAAVLARLWMLGLAVPREPAMDALSTSWRVALDHDLLATTDDEVRGLVDLSPHSDGEHDWWVVSDQTSMATGDPLHPDHVVGVGGASTTLASWTPRPWVERALDLGTGSGVQLPHLSSHTKHRVATDVSHRALRCAALTASLNDVSVDLRHGSWFDPVAGERFGLVVSNPPFVITPRNDASTLTYRDGGGVGDEVLESLVREVGAHLVPGGLAQFLGNWEVVDGAPWHERVGTWVRDSGLDALVVQREVVDVSEYAQTWARDAGTPPGSAAAQRWYADSLADFDQRGVTHVGFGVVTLQRPSEARPTWTHLEDLRGSLEHPVGPHVLAQLRARSWLAMHSDEEVLSVPWTVAVDVTVETVTRPGSPDPLLIRARQASGFGCVRQLSAVTAGVLGACDGELSAHQLAVAVAALLDEDPAQARAELAIELRAWVAWGLVR
ncbi:MAG: methyltransferase [Ornithinimicrobium sp.]